MKKGFIVLLLLFSAPMFYAALYDFGSMQQGNSATAFRGDNLSFNLYFFVDDRYGDRITHIRVIPAKVPDGWTVAFDPSTHPVRLNISGIVTSTEENLYVEPRPVLPSIPDSPEAGVDYLFSPSGLGYLQAKKMVVTIHIPNDAELGKTYDIDVDAYADWYGSAGVVSLTQSRGFVYSVSVISPEYTEQILPPESTNRTTNETPASGTGTGGISLGKDTLVMGFMGLIIVLLLVYIALRRPPARAGKWRA